MKKAIVVAFASMFLFACGGGDEEEDTTTTTDAGVKVDAGTKTDAGTTTDAGHVTTDAGTTSTCLASDNLGSPTPVDQQASSGTLSDGTAAIGAFADLNTDVDYVAITLYDGYGAFTTGGLKTGTFEITGEEANLDTCGVCVTLGADYSTSTEEDAQSYIATGGTVVIDSISGTFKATLTGITFAEIDSEGAVVSGGCTSALSSLTIDTTIQSSAK